MFTRSKKILSVMVAMAITAGIMPFFPISGGGGRNTPLAKFWQFSPQIAQANDVVTIDVGTVDSSGTGYTYSSNKITLTGGYDYVITGSTTTKQISTGYTTVNVTLDNATIDSSATDYVCAFEPFDGSTVNLTLIGANTLKSGTTEPGLEVAGNSTLTIGGTGSLEAVGGDSGAGIGGDSGLIVGAIIINSGIITATGGFGGAGIGSGYDGNSGNITINGGTINANGSESGAGIGGGEENDGGEITINGGTINATGGENSAGIGGGYDGEGGNITINGGTINAIGGTYGAAIGGGDGYSSTGTVKINGGSVYVNNFSGPQPKNSNSDNVYLNTLTVSDPGIEFLKFTGGTFGANTFVDDTELTTGQYGIHDTLTDKDGKLYLWLPSSGEEALSLTAFGNEYSATYTRAAANNTNVQTLAGEYLPALQVTGENANDTAYVQWASVYAGLTDLRFKQYGTYTLTLREGVPCTFREEISISKNTNVDLTLDGVKIDVSAINDGCAFYNQGTVNLTLVGENSLKSKDKWAGLDVTENSTLIIAGAGSLEAIGGAEAAGIGGDADMNGYSYDVGEITISSGTITAIGGDSAAGIGSGNAKNSGKITINGGTINATGGDKGAGIGGGFQGKGGDTTINDGIIKAEGGSAAAGIGGGGNNGLEGSDGKSEGGKITITGGTVTAKGPTSGAGIGGGMNSNGGEINITDGTITASGGAGAGIGGGGFGIGGEINISGGTVTATSTSGAGIGNGGMGPSGGEINITSGTVIATSGVGAGIGGGAGTASGAGEINISGGTINATGGTNGAAIGGSNSYKTTGTVTIDGGSVKMSNFDGPQPKNSEIENVYLNTLTLDDPSAANVRVTKVSTAAVAGPASAIMAGEYGTNGVYTDESGILYAWLPDSNTAEEELTVKAGGKTYTSTYIRAADNTNAETLAKIAGVDDVKVLLTPDSTSKNAGYDGHIDVSFDASSIGYEAYALAIPMLFDKNTIEITNLETVNFATKNLTGLLVNGTFLSGARDYDSSSEVLSVINSEGKFLLSWTVEEDIPLVPHTLTGDVYFRIHYRVKENVPTSASFAIGEYNIDNGIDQDQIFGVDGLGILSSNQDDFGAYLLVEGEYGILTQDYISVTVKDMPPVTISGDVNSISLQGRAMLTGKQRTPISAVSYTPNLSKIDAGIRVEMYEVDNAGEVVKQVGSVAYTQEMNMTAAIGNPSSTLYNYTLNIPRTVANDLKISDPTGSSPKYMLRFSRFGDNGGSVVGTVREESYLWADIYLDGTAVNTGIIDESTPLTVGDTAYLYAGAFYLPTAEKFALTTSDLNTIKGQVGNADITGVTTIYNINEYLGVDAADYTTVLRYVGQTKLQSLPLAVTN